MFSFFILRQIERFTDALKEGITCGMVASAAVLKDVDSQLEELIYSDLEPLLVPIKATYTAESKIVLKIIIYLFTFNNCNLFLFFLFNIVQK